MPNKVIISTSKCQSFLLAISRSINQSINQSISQSVNQPINRSINLRSPPVNVLCRERMTCAVEQPCTHGLFLFWSRRDYITREIKQQGRRRLRKRHLKREVALPQNFIGLIPSGLIRQMLVYFFRVKF